MQTQNLPHHYSYSWQKLTESYSQLNYQHLKSCQSIRNFHLRKMWNLMLTISILCHKSQSLRSSDAWVDDIEKLESAMSNRIETFAFPNKIGLSTRENKFVIRDVSNSNKGISFQPLYFKFRNKFRGNKEIAQDRSSQMNPKYWIQGYSYRVGNGVNI